MHDLFIAFAIAVLVLMVANLYRGVRGPTIFDRLLGLGLIGSKTLIVLLVIGYIYGRQDFFIDCAITYALLNFIGVLIASKYFIRGGLEEGL